MSAASDATDARAGRAGALWVVATPIGNLGDLSARAEAALRSADVVACEDTRRAGGLLAHLGASRPAMVVLNDHTERRVVDRLIDELHRGRSVALISDAGTPAISDPGWRLLRAAIEAGLEVDVLPGPSAAVTAAVISGLPIDRFCFEGFLPRKGAERRVRLAELADERRTTVLFEAPHRLARTIEDLASCCEPSRPVVIARELTKLHQQVWRGDLAGASRWIEAHPPRGEVAVVLGGAVAAPVDDQAIRVALDAELAAGSTRRDAVAQVAGAFGVPKRRVFDLLSP